ncbi:MAG TPA: three-Cys-motif partner protein TcmP [Saprospiraceae bacterium]|nr:three-Cys-motif partner protein TcmP [Saprospiraceae bacterium]
MIRKRKVKVKDVVLPHSKAKVEFFKSYLEKYLSILVNSEYISEINIVDAFCGKGEYSDGGIGSPIESFYAIEKVIQSSLYKAKSTTINHIINDIKPENTKSVIEYFDQKGGISGWNFESHNYDFEAFKSYLYNLVDNQTSKTRTLIFLDPYGYKNIDKATILDLTRNNKTEIVLWLPIANMKRFIDKSKDTDLAAFLPLKSFINAFFPDNQDEIFSTMGVFEFINKITMSLRVNNLYTTSYYIERDQANYYSLFFLSPNNLGFEKILEVKWQLDEINGRGFSQIKPATLFDDEFKLEDKTKKLDYLKSELKSFLVISKSNLEIRQFMLLNEFLPKHFVPILKDWLKLEIIDCTDSSGKKVSKILTEDFNYKNFKNKTHLYSVKYLK